MHMGEEIIIHWSTIQFNPPVFQGAHGFAVAIRAICLLTTPTRNSSPESGLLCPEFRTKRTRIRLSHNKLGMIFQINIIFNFLV
jgi:hypothetical protein